MSDRSHCRSCSAPILFVPVEPRRRYMPLDLEQDMAGTIVLDGPTYRLSSAYDVPPSSPRYRRHLCPKADTHRKKKQ